MSDQYDVSVPGGGGVPDILNLPNYLTAQDAGLMYEEKFMVQVTLKGGKLKAPLVLGSVPDKQPNPADISGSKSFGVEVLDTTPYKPLTQNTVKDGVWDLNFSVDTYHKATGDIFKELDAGPYILTISLFEIKVYLKKLDFKQHSGREWYYTWTLNFVEKNSRPGDNAIIGEAKQTPMPAVYEASSDVSGFDVSPYGG
jgi:hypothetical protein